MHEESVSQQTDKYLEILTFYEQRARVGLAEVSKQIMNSHPASRRCLDFLRVIQVLLPRHRDERNNS